MSWSNTTLREVLRPVKRPEAPLPGTVYRQLGVKLWGEGAYERESIDGVATKYSTLSRVKADDVVVNKIWARNGSVAVVQEPLAGCYVSGEFPTFTTNPEKLLPRWMHWLTKVPNFWWQCDEKSRGTSGKNRIKPEQFLSVEIPLPPLAEQRRIVARIEALAAKIAEARSLRQFEAQEIRSMQRGAFARIAKRAPRRPMREVAPLARRPVEVEMESSYPEVGIRSFGNGTFHKPALSGFELGSKRVYWIEPGDLLFSNVFAWEGAIAVAKTKDRGRVGSHRFITCVPQENIATSQFLRFYFLTDEGLELIRVASPGGAGRNRTLGLAALEAIEVPIPPIEAQVWFDGLQTKVDEIKRVQFETTAALNAILPAILHRAFKGEL
jgi:type I restriction enzyme S subunit